MAQWAEVFRRSFLERQHRCNTTYQQQQLNTVRAALKFSWAANLSCSPDKAAQQR